MRLVIAVLCALVALPALAQNYPSRPVRVVVPFPAGSATDVVTRIVGRELQEALGQPFVVENKAGAQAIVGSDFVAKSAQVSAAQLASMAGLQVLDVPYKGIPLAVNDVLSGTVDFTFADLPNALGQSKGGALRILAVTSEKRSPLAPDLPALAEVLPGYDITAWIALFAPAGTPKEAISAVHQATVKALAKPDVVSRLAAVGMTPAPMTPDELGRYLRAEIDKWAKLVKQAGIQPE